MLLAVSWLPHLFFAPLHLAATADGTASSETLGTIPFPAKAAQFHQFRSPSLQPWCLKLLGLAPVAAPAQSHLTAFGLGTAWHPASAPAELLKTWQFRQRTALFPRDPCRA